MAIGQTIFNKLQNVPKGTTLKIIYDGGSTPGRTRYAKYDSMCICPSSIDPHEGYVNIIENHEYKTLFVKKIRTFFRSILSPSKLEGFLFQSGGKDKCNFEIHKQKYFVFRNQK